MICDKGQDMARVELSGQDLHRRKVAVRHYHVQSSTVRR